MAWCIYINLNVNLLEIIVYNLCNINIHKYILLIFKTTNYIFKPTNTKYNTIPL